MSDSPNTDGKQVEVGVSASGGISFKRVISGVICGVFFYLVGAGWQNPFVGAIFAVIAFLIGYSSGKFIY